MTLFIHTPKHKQLSMKVTLMMCFNQSILQLYQTYKNLQGKAQAGLLIQSQIIMLVLQYNPLAGSGYAKLQEELDHRNSLIFKILMIMNALNDVQSHT